MSRRSFRMGDLVRVERDETRWPSKGSWPKYRGRVGTIVSINRSDHECGLSWRPNAAAQLGTNTVVGVDSWFLPHEIVLVDESSGKESRSASLADPSGGPGGKRPQTTEDDPRVHIEAQESVDIGRTRPGASGRQLTVWGARGACGGRAA